MLKIFIALAICISIGSPAQAQQTRCAERAGVVIKLLDKYGETRQSIGMLPNGSIFELFASISTGTWSVLITSPKGISCMPASGSDFERVDEPAAPAGMRM